MPFAFRAHPIPRHARLIMNDGNAFAHDPIKQGGFSYIRTPDNGDQT
jgi:hypothetical protein